MQPGLAILVRSLEHDRAAIPGRRHRASPLTRPRGPGVGLPESGRDLSPLGLAILVEKGVLGDSTDSCLAQLSQGVPGSQQRPPQTRLSWGSP